MSESKLHPADAFARQVLVLTGAIFASIGLASLFVPNLVADFVNIRLDDALARFDFRAVFGGLQTGIGAFVIVAALRKAWRLPALNMASLALGGLLLGRVVSLAVDESPGLIGWTLLGLEVALISVILFSFLRLHRARAEERAEERAQVVADEQSAAP